MKKLILFDFDGVLFNSKKNMEISWKAVMKKYSLKGLMTESKVMCISEKVLSVFKQAGWKKLEIFEAGEELTKLKK